VKEMAVTYDKYYQTEDLFGEPYPELITFFSEYPTKSKVLDLGCGQGRDSIALARLGFTVTGVDNSKVGIDQMIRVGEKENLNLTGLVHDIYTYDRFSDFDIILLDSMFHFAKKDKEKEVGLIQRIISDLKIGSLLVVCIQNTGNKVDILYRAIDFEKKLKRLADKAFKYVFEDKASSHQIETDYRMIILKK
jgi:SAM-dependent methyltransferase